MYKRRHQKQCPRSIQEVYKTSQKAQNRGVEIETKNITCPYFEPNQSMKVTSEKRFKTIDTLIQAQRLHTKEFSIFGAKAPHYQMLTYSFPSILSKINIKGSFAKPFYELSPQMTHVTQEEFPSLNKKKSKTHQRGRKEDSKKPESLHKQEEGDPLSLLQRGIENTYLPKSAPSFDIGPKLRLSPKKPPKQRKPPYEAHSLSKYYH